MDDCWFTNMFGCLFLNVSLGSGWGLAICIVGLGHNLHEKQSAVSGFPNILGTGPWEVQGLWQTGRQSQDRLWRYFGAGIRLFALCGGGGWNILRSDASTLQPPKDSVSLVFSWFTHMPRPDNTACMYLYMHVIHKYCVCVCVIQSHLMRPNLFESFWCNML